jgi:hypothetical protein
MNQAAEKSSGEAPRVDAFFPSTVRAGIRRSGAFRRAAVGLDDFFYGRKPVPGAPPGWLPGGPAPRPLAARQ